MSAYAGAGGPSLISLIKRTSPYEEVEQNMLPPVPDLPKIDRELEHYFQVAKQIQAALTHYRAEARRCTEELSVLQTQHSQMRFELESRLNESLQKEEHARARAQALEQGTITSQNRLREVVARNAQLNEERKRLEHNTEVYRSHLQSTSQREASLKALVENLRASEKLHAASVLQLQSQLAEYERTEKTTLEQAETARKELEVYRAQNKKLEVDDGVLSAKLAYYQEREKVTLAEIETLKANATSHSESLKKLSDELARTRHELNRYKSAWPNITALQNQATRASNENEKFQEQIENLQKALDGNKGRLAQVEESMNKEKRDKQIALNCLHTAEAKIEELTQELELVRQRAVESQPGQVTALKLL